MTTDTFELTEREQKLLDDVRSLLIADRQRQSETEQTDQTPVKPTVKPQENKNYTYVECIAIAIFAKLAVEGVFDANAVDMCQPHNVFRYIEDALEASMKNFGAECDLYNLIKRSQEWEFYKRGTR